MTGPGPRRVVAKLGSTITLAREVPRACVIHRPEAAPGFGSVDDMLFSDV